MRVNPYWKPPWTRLVRDLELRYNHPVGRPWDDFPHSHWGPVSTKVCALADWVTNYWAHD